ncbi:hypothetical protein [Acetobacter musti]|uniref:hypothetical protein n=1 Tax=Acetobacter musti TaxID=864732 RepID=UPI0018E95156|nr:hypothetical protein [Acetobacter musti]
MVGAAHEVAQGGSGAGAVDVFCAFLIGDVVFVDGAEVDAEAGFAGAVGQAGVKLGGGKEDEAAGRDDVAGVGAVTDRGGRRERRAGCCR